VDSFSFSTLINSVEPSYTHKKTSKKKYKKERNDWDPKWPQTYPWLVRREMKEESNLVTVCFLNLYI